MSSYGVGSVVRLTTSVRGSDGELTDPDTITLTLRLPGGDTVGPYDSDTTPAVVRDGLGLYHLDFPTTLTGQHVARWVTTLPGAVDEEPFDVEGIWGETGIISLADAKHHLKKSVTSTDDDVKLTGMILGATDMIEERIGHVLVKEMTVVVRAANGVLILPERPVLEVMSVHVVPGLAGVVAEDLETGGTGWFCSKEGVLETSASPFAGRYRVTYRVGRQPVQAKIRLACKELVAHMWRTSQLNADGGRPQMQTDPQVAPASSFALPYNVRQLLGLDRAQRDIPVVG
ncbi:head-tail connector protein [Nonomuraea sp. NPDC050786]|uniref:head-tail connector protein n=1 Tax=Nonomuraea sp. NPDC050786 TaxID=3154840 RepID=UPI0033D30D3C